MHGTTVKKKEVKKVTMFSYLLQLSTFIHLTVIKVFRNPSIPLHIPDTEKRVCINQQVTYKNKRDISHNVTSFF